MNYFFQQYYSLIAELKEEKAHLEIDLKQRDQLLGKIFNCFKKKIEDVAVETNDKYFLRRLCNDLRSVIKIYGGQNKVSIKPHLFIIFELKF